MTFTITSLAPPAPVKAFDSSHDAQDPSDSDDSSSERPHKRPRTAHSIITPGETVTEDPQWMRYVSLRRPAHEALQ